MQCRYCRAWNEADERRCVRCGRRLHQAASRPSPGTFPLSTSTAPALEMLPGRDPGQVRSPELNQNDAAKRAEQISYQTSLFRDVSNSPKVIPIPTLTPVRPRTNPEWAREDRERDDSAQRKRASRPKPVARNASNRRRDSQASLDFYGAGGGQPAVGTALEGVIFCDVPVALPAHRSIAAVFDAAMVLLGVGLFLSVFVLVPAILGIDGGVGAMGLMNAGNAMVFVCAAGVIALFYRLLWCIGNGDTPGMRFAGLRLVDFDGRVPDRERRGMRQLAGLLSVISAGLGLVWALVDEENLTWHDHISKTFPTEG
jgi:uncharacterized RDD family membrane protein YckC